MGLVTSLIQNVLPPQVYSSLFKVSYLAVLIPTALVVISAILSAQAMGGTLGQGLKKIAIGTIVDTILIATYLMLEHGFKGSLDDQEIQMFFILSVIFAAIFLISGYVQVYRISKKLKLFA